MLAVVMAGGRGTRLQPLTSRRPKPMVPVVDKPILEHSLNILRRHGFREVILTLHYLPGVVMSYFGDGSALGVGLSYSVEEKPLGTAGGVRAALRGRSPERILVWSGDLLSVFDISGMLRYHEGKGGLVTMAVTRVDDPTKFGMVLPDEEMRVKEFVEKPEPSKAVSNVINCGIYVLEPEVLEKIPREGFYDFARDLFPKLLREGEPIYAYPVKGFWTDVGDPRQYMEVNFSALGGRIPGLAVDGVETSEGVWLGDGAEVGGSVRPPVFIGRGAKLSRGAMVGPNAVIGEGVTVGPEAEVSGSIVWRGSAIAGGSRVVGAIIGSNCVIQRGAKVLAGAIISDECVIGENSTIKPGVKLWPGKRVAPNSVISSDLTR